MNNEALILTAGGLKGAFQVGALTTILLNNPDYNPRVVSGISTGALSASILAQSTYGSYNSFVYYFSKLSEIYGELDGPLGSIRWPGGYAGMARGIFFNGSLEDPRKLRDLIHQYVDPVALERSGRKFRCGSVNLASGQYHTATEKSDHILDFILSSATIPMLWPPVLIEGNYYIDGGVRNMFPLGDTIDAMKGMTPEGMELKITLLMTTPIGIRPIKIDRDPSSYRILGRTVDISTHQILISDLKELVSKNKLAQAGDTRCRFIDLDLVYPSEYYDTSLTADPSLIRRMSNDGIMKAKNPIGAERLEQILREGNYV